MANASITITGANAIEHVYSLGGADQTKTSRVRIGMNTYRLLENFFASFAITACSAPDWVSMWKRAAGE